MHSKYKTNFKSFKKTDLLNNINNYFIKVDYFDKIGIKKYNTNIPLKYMFNQKSLNKTQSN